MAILKVKQMQARAANSVTSNRNQWQYTEEIKEDARKWRRLLAKSEIAAGLA